VAYPTLLFVGQAAAGLLGNAQPGGPPPPQPPDLEHAYWSPGIIIAYRGLLGLMLAYHGLAALRAAYADLPTLHPHLAGHAAMAGHRGIQTAMVGDEALSAVVRDCPPARIGFPAVAQAYAGYPGLLRAYAGLSFLRAAYGYPVQPVDPALPPHRLHPAVVGAQGVRLATLGFGGMAHAFAELWGTLEGLRVLPGLQPGDGGGPHGPGGGGFGAPGGGGPQGFGGGGGNVGAGGGNGPPDRNAAGGHAATPREAGKRADPSGDREQGPKRAKPSPRQRTTLEGGGQHGMSDDAPALEVASESSIGRSFLAIVVRHRFKGLQNFVSSGVILHKGVCWDMKNS
jgi:hypothetical protein